MSDTPSNCDFKKTTVDVIAELQRDLAAANAEREELRKALIKIRSHTSYITPPDGDRSGLMQGLLMSIERIADAAIAAREKP